MSATIYQDLNKAFNMINFDTNGNLSVNHPLYSDSNVEGNTEQVTSESTGNSPEYSHKNGSNLSGCYRGQLITCSAKDSIDGLLFDRMDAMEIQTSSNDSFQDQSLNHIL